MTDHTEQDVSFIGSDKEACKFIAAVSWPLERKENRDAWAVTMLHRPDLLALEVARARARLEAAIAQVTPPPALGTPRNPVDGATHPCSTPGYAGRHTAVGAGGAISPPYRCHGCGTWFTTPEPR